MTWLLVIACGLILWWLLRDNRNSPTISSPPKVEQNREQQHLRNSLAFVRKQQRELQAAQRAAKIVEDKENQRREQWQRRYAEQRIETLDNLSGIEFEEFLSGLFEKQGYAVEHTPVSGDYGADLILSRNNERIAVQAKRYSNTVGVNAVQEVVAARGFYHCQQAWVVTTASFTPNAHALAHKNAVTLIDRQSLARMLP